MENSWKQDLKKYMNDNHHIIKTYGNQEELFRVLKLLFAAGYVFSSTYRVRTIENFTKLYGTEASFFWSWNYITFPKDTGCNVVMEPIIYRNIYRNEKYHRLIEVEDFLKLPENER